MALHSEAYALCAKIAMAMNAAAPGLRAKVTISLDGTKVRPEHIVLELRPPQPRAGMGEEGSMKV
jgi:hypothetical protein